MKFYADAVSKLARKKTVYISGPGGEDIPFAPVVPKATVRCAITDLVQSIDVGKHIDPRIIQSQLFIQHEINCPIELAISLLASLEAYVIGKMLEGHFAVFFERKNP